MNKLIREIELILPEFKTHNDAREWFKAKFGDAFVWAESEDDIIGEPTSFYHLILDRSVYNAFMRRLEEYGYSTWMDGLTSYQEIQITESGSVTIVY
ncbi:hypothetical protein EV207_102258 [Scopulibacillus darangshiensis]|uniref:Uncharacterized protein n=1 Tax=Scopulibacillus darangshiensis TaxID=442528 RepID=A0A4R2PCX1_9BACL|nr:hypothetical protein [Scopulibacillus darangshiensis]TCP31765.1 hypothetical protein EV207_102258 [Scopulibacillus darangshiensis]